MDYAFAYPCKNLRLAAAPVTSKRGRIQWYFEDPPRLCLFAAPSHRVASWGNTDNCDLFVDTWGRIEWLEELVAELKARLFEHRHSIWGSQYAKAEDIPLQPLCKPSCYVAERIHMQVEGWNENIRGITRDQFGFPLVDWDQSLPHAAEGTRFIGGLYGPWDVTPGLMTRVTFTFDRIVVSRKSKTARLVLRACVVDANSERNGDGASDSETEG